MKELYYGVSSPPLQDSILPFLYPGWRTNSNSIYIITITIYCHLLSIAPSRVLAAAVLHFQPPLAPSTSSIITKHRHHYTISPANTTLTAIAQYLNTDINGI